ncbi:MAG: ATP-binding domain-containing protein, partial [Chloroflexi bacterium]|nr:ATP-binding domain-containing protein [Chloroflexota bacterium]
YERAEIKDMLAYLRAIANPADAVSVKRVVNVPKRGLGKAAIAWVDLFAAQEGIDFMTALGRSDEIPQLTPAARKGIASFVGILDELQAMNRNPKVTLEVTVRELIERSGYLAALEAERTIEAQSRAENVQELVSVVQEAESEGKITLEDFLAGVALVSDLDQLAEEEKAVTLMTTHNAKGLEFPVVFIAGMEDGVFPHMRSMTDANELEEERRLCYVGITRAQRKLYLTNARSRNLWGDTRWNTPSRFLREIPEEFIAVCERKIDANAQVNVKAIGADFRIGDLVMHATFGKGKVIGLKGSDQLTVRFPEGEKTLLLGYAPLEKCGS